MYSESSDGGFVKKCASCSKDLPEAALHCVFCGAKQSPGSAVQPGVAKTAFGYSQNEVMNQLGRPNQSAAPTYTPPSSTAPYGQRPQSPSQAPPYQQQPYQQGPYQGPPVPSNPHAATVALAPGGGQLPPQQLQPTPMALASTLPAPYYPPPGNQNPYQQGPYQGGMGINAPMEHTPPHFAPQGGPGPYLAGAMQVTPRPIEPWRDKLRMMMFIWGAVMLVVFATPLSVDPLHFKWDELSGAPAKALINTVLPAAIGLLAIVFGSIPMPTFARGIVATVLGLAAMFVPIGLHGEVPPWQALLLFAALLTLIPGLLVRNEYTDSLTARILVTIGVICMLLPLLVPENGELPLVGLFKTLIDAPGKAKVGPILHVGLIVVVVMSLLAWMPAPATGAAKIFAWTILLWAALEDTVAEILTAHDPTDVFTKTPSQAVAWGLVAATLVFIGYGGATVIGKQLE